MKISKLIKELQFHQEKYGDIEVKQLIGITNGSSLEDIVCEKLVPIKKVKYYKKSNSTYVDFC